MALSFLKETGTEINEAKFERKGPVYYKENI